MARQFKAALIRVLASFNLNFSHVKLRFNCLQSAAIVFLSALFLDPLGAPSLSDNVNSL
jgi:hypothetical protein